jgi:hypothetical protein
MVRDSLESIENAREARSGVSLTDSSSLGWESEASGLVARYASAPSPQGSTRTKLSALTGPSLGPPLRTFATQRMPRLDAAGPQSTSAEGGVSSRLPHAHDPVRCYLSQAPPTGRSWAPNQWSQRSRGGSSRTRLDYPLPRRTFRQFGGPDSVFCECHSGRQSEGPLRVGSSCLEPGISSASSFRVGVPVAWNGAAVLDTRSGGSRYLDFLLSGLDRSGFRVEPPCQEI